MCVKCIFERPDTERPLFKMCLTTRAPSAPRTVLWCNHHGRNKAVFIVLDSFLRTWHIHIWTLSARKKFRGNCSWQRVTCVRCNFARIEPKLVDCNVNIVDARRSENVYSNGWVMIDKWHFRVSKYSISSSKSQIDKINGKNFRLWYLGCVY